MNVESDIKIDEKVKQKIQEPKHWKVIFLNDEYTPMDFVIQVLQEVFKHSHDTATNITMQVHNEGSGIAGVYTFEIAEVKAVEATTLARSSGFPLQVKMEEE
jgi:ATP-dependent Clp protease adaptor protein ClpS